MFKTALQFCFIDRVAGIKLCSSFCLLVFAAVFDGLTYKEVAMVLQQIASSQDRSFFPIGFAAGFICMKTGCQFLAAFLSAQAAFRIQNIIQKNLFDKILSEPFQKEKEVESGVITSSEYIFRFAVDLGYLCTHSCLIITYLTLLIYYHLPFTLLVSILAGVHILISRVTTKYVSLSSQKFAEQREVFSKKIQALSFARKTIHFFCRDRIAHEQIDIYRERMGKVGEILFRNQAISSAFSEWKGMVVILALLFSAYFFSTVSIDLLCILLALSFRCMARLIGVFQQMSITATYSTQVAQALNNAKRGGLSKIDFSEKLGAITGVGIGGIHNVQPLDIEIRKGRWVALIGPSGSGKTTILQMLLREIEGMSGKVLWNGKERSIFCTRSVYNQIGVVSPDLPLIEKTPRDNLYVQPEIVYEGIGGELLNRNDMHLSEGERGRLSLLRALQHNPSLLFLDEPFAHLDSRTELSIIQTLFSMKEKFGMLITTHSPLILPYVDEIIILKEGEVVAKGSYESLQNSVVFEEVFSSSYAIF